LADSWLLLSQYGNVTVQDATRKAQPLIEKALALDAESAEAYASLGLARWQIGQLDSAESSLRQAIRLNGDYIPARLWLGGLLGEAGRFPEQSLVLEEAMRLDPLNELLAINYAGNLFTRGDASGGREVIRRLLEVKPDSTSLLRTSAQLAQASGDLAQGWRDASRAYALEPASPAVVTAMSDAWMDLGATEEAEQVLHAGLDTGSENMKLRMSYFLVMLVQRRLEEAESFLRDSFGDSIEDLPEQLRRMAHFQRGMLALARGDDKKALIEIERAVPEDSVVASIDGMQLWVLTLASVVHQRNGDESMAEQRLQEADGTGTGSPPGRL
jgi:tetratricopeptide (TPR) repeat protein